MAGLALERGLWAELIPDGLHVHPAALRLALKSVPGLYFVTDAVAAAGMPDGVYPLGAHQVEKRGEGVWLGESLAGSTLTMDQALRKLVAFGLSLEEAARRLSTYPARYLGLKDRGRSPLASGRTFWCWARTCGWRRCTWGKAGGPVGQRYPGSHRQPSVHQTRCPVR